uniref:Trichohyalin-plectin-homology domain-containing protein n=1 Tax=Globisporangium ultimum (strain ATCC 200006 / CBS 805.95 / DAOM BR144) TaxID=431595 RepID=K3X0I7_GLOUD
QKPDLSRDELRKKQQVYTQRVHEENLKREAARALILEKQREAARRAELERQRLDEEQRQLRMAHAQALREDLERRGLIAIKELQSKKDEKQRKEEEARLRLEQAQQKIAAQVLSDETQQILKRKQRRSSRSNDLGAPRQ